MNLIEQAKELQTMAERGEAPDHIAPIMRAFLECEEVLQRYKSTWLAEGPDHYPARALLDKLRSES